MTTSTEVFNPLLIEDIKKKDFIISNNEILSSDFEYKHLKYKHKILKEHKLEYFSFNTELYMLGKFNIFIKHPITEEVTNFNFEYDTFTTLTPADIQSKNSALMLAYHSGLVNDFFNNELTLTHCGELPHENYDFFITSQNGTRQRISLRNYSTYIDGVFEGKDKVVLIISELYKYEEINLKNLYLPFLYFKSRTNKDVIPMFMSYSNDLFKFSQITFNESDILNLGYVNKHQTYKLSNDKIVYKDLINIMQSVEIVKEKEIAFPQANDFDRIVDLVHLLNNTEYNFNEITKNYGFVERQTQYYTDAAIYLDLIRFRQENNTKIFTLSPKGRKIVSSRIKKKYTILIESILEHEVFNQTFKLTLNDDLKLPSTTKIVEIMKSTKVYNIKSDSTYSRRASTVQAWVKWINELPKLYY